MRQTQLFTKTRREAPADETSKNAQLLIRGGYVHKEMAGVYSFLPLGLLVIEKIKKIIKEEMDSVGGQELLMSALQDPELWQKTNRWGDDVVDSWFKTKLKNGNEVGLGFTHEEPVVKIAKENISSYKDLPILLYQMQNKFRNELRAKSGIMRGREFIMKDMYSFARTQEEHEELYAKIREAYVRIFSRAGIGGRTYVTFASGGVFSKYSEEFQTESDAGEDLIYVDSDKNIAVNKEVLLPEVLEDLKLKQENLVEKKSIEVGNIFHLGTKFSSALGLKFKNEKGEEVIPIMGCYGIGLGRLMGTIVESLSDEKGIVWPEGVAPFKYHIVEIASENPKVRETALTLYKKLGENNCLYDDREARAGEKFADADLLGMPWQITVGERSLENGGVELKNRKTGEVKIVSPDSLS